MRRVALTCHHRPQVLALEKDFSMQTPCSRRLPGSQPPPQSASSGHDARFRPDTGFLVTPDSWSLISQVGPLRARAEVVRRLHETCSGRIYGFLRKSLPADAAEDLTQEVFLHVHRSLPSYDPSRPLSPWVYTIATNKVRDHWRSRQSQEDRRAQSVDDEESAPVLTDGGGGPTTDIEAGETAGEVADAVAALPEMLRQTFVLRYYEGLSFEEIGRMVERNEAAVRKRYSRALAELRDSLAHLASG